MKILYISSLNTPQREKELEMCLKENLLNHQAQKFNNFMVKGLVSNGCNLEHLTTCSSLSKLAKRKYLKKSIHYYSDVKYYSLPVIFIPFIQFIFAYFNTIFFLLGWLIKYRKENKIIICDVTEVFYSFAAVTMSRIFKVPIVAIVTDLPENTVGNSKNNQFKNAMISIYKYFTRWFINKFNLYILLTKQMNDVVNKKRKPYIIIEGIVDKDLKYKNNLLENKHTSKVILYAGLLEKRFGINMLVEAFSRITNSEYELHLYGKGSSEDFIKKVMKLDNRIKYFGLVSNDLVVDEEIKASLLINPRPSNQEFTKYSFPSKIMEYMSTGTPVLTTGLPGMPNEYYRYVYIIENETVEGLANTIEKILSLPSNELHQFGLRAKEFVIKEKNYLVQGKKILDFIISELIS